MEWWITLILNLNDTHLEQQLSTVVNMVSDWAGEIQQEVVKEMAQVQLEIGVEMLLDVKVHIPYWFIFLSVQA